MNKFSCGVFFIAKIDNENSVAMIIEERREF
jgi:hypothetical protein